MNRRSRLVHGLRALLLLSLALVVSVGCAESPAQKKQKATASGERYLAEGKADEAIIELRKALQVDADFVPALHALSRAYAAKSWYGDAVRELARAQKLQPNSIPIALSLGRAYLDAGAFGQAFAEADKVLSTDRKNAEAYSIKAAALLGQGKSDEALQIVDDAPPGSIADADLIRALVLQRRGNLEEAERSYRAFLAKQPGNLESLIGLASIQLGQKKYDEAAKLYGEAKKLKPLDPRPRLGLAAALAGGGLTAEAIRELEEVDPRARSGQLIMALATYYLRANRPADTQRLLEPVLERIPGLTVGRYMLGRAYLANRRFDLAVAQFEELARQAPNDPSVRLYLASAYASVGKGKEALAELDRVAKVAAKLPGYHIERGRALLLLGKTDEALQSARAAQALAPDRTQPYMLMGEIYALRKDYQSARGMFARASELNVTDPTPHLALGQLAEYEKNSDVALKEFEAAIHADPKWLRAARAKAALLMQEKRAKEAIQFAEGLAKAEPSNSQFQSLLASLYGRDQQWDKATAAYRRALELDEKAIEARLGLANIALAKGRDEEAITYLQATVQQEPGNSLAVMLIASLYDRLARYDQEQSVLEVAVKANPRQPILGLALGELYLKKGRYDDAIASANDLLSVNPELASARLIRGQALLAKGDPGGLKEFVDVARANPKSAPAQYFLARAYVRSGRLPEAQAAYREAIRINPEFKDAKTELAALSGQKLDQGEQLKEIELLRAEAKARPKDVAVRERLARRLLANGQVKPAREELKAVLELAPANVDANLLMANIVAKEGRREEAANYARAVLRTNPQHVDANLLLANFMNQSGRREEAVKHLEAVLKVSPTRSDVKFLLGGAYVQQRRVPDALRLARNLEKSEPKNPAGPLLLGTVLSLDQKPQGAIEAFNTALKLKSDLPDAYRGLGQAYQQLNQMDRAAEAYQRAIALNGNDVASLNNLAWLTSEVRKKSDEALPLAVKAEQLAPRSPEVLDTLGWIHYRRGAFTEAEKYLARAVEHAPRSGVIQYHLGMTQARVGKKQDAVSTLKRAAQLDPKLAETEQIAIRVKELGG